MASTGDTWRLGRRPALDGVRGLAILFVLAGHVGFPLVRDSGKTGVAIFFTLSGFLISSLLLDEIDRRGTVNLLRFYRRRALRLLPAQLVCVAIVAVTCLRLGPEFITPGQVASAALYVSNFTAPFMGVLGHFWSLAIEEQFYLVWAPVLLVLAARVSRHVLLGLVVAGAVASFCARVAFFDVTFAGVRIDAWPMLQADALLVGCALALLMRVRVESGGHRRLALAAVAVLLCVGLLPGGTVARWGIGIAALATAVLIFSAAQGRGCRWLSWAPLVLVGRRSYGLYVWHYPVLFIAAVGFHIQSWVALALIVWPSSALLCAASWRYVETPFLRMKERANEAHGSVAVVLRPEVQRLEGVGGDRPGGGTRHPGQQSQRDVASADVAGRQRAG